LALSLHLISKGNKDMSTNKSVAAIALAFLALFTAACTTNTDSRQSKEENNGKNNIVNKTVKKGKTMKTVEMTSEMFKSKIMNYETSSEWNYKGERPVLIDFYATWCGPCKATAPNVEKIAEEYEGKVDVYKVDVDQQQELAAVFGVQSIPTILFIPTAGTPTKNVGAMSYAQLKEAVNQVLLK